MNSSSLRKILGIVLYIGNHVNTSGMRGKDRVTAIQLSSLLKLQQAKTFDRKTSFLEYVVRILRRSSPGVLRLYRPEMPSLSRAANIQWAESVSELKALEENLAELRSMALQFGTENLQKQHPHQDHIYTEKETSVLHLSSLGQFVLRASLLITTVYAEIDAANIVFDQLVHYFGESPDPQTAKESSEAAPQILLYLSQFCADLDVAVDRAEEYEKARSRELRRGAYAAANLATISTETKEKTALSVSPSYASRGVVKARARPGRTTPTQFPIRSPVPTHYSRKV